jgi:hypothetical protein
MLPPSWGWQLIALMLETARIFYHSTQRNIPEDGHFQFTTTSE